MASGLDSLLGGNPPQLTIGDVEVSASISEVHSLAADVTEFPVETGADISDHYRPKPDSVQIEGIISDVKLETGYPGQTVIEQFRTSPSNDPTIEAWKKIAGYILKRQTVDIRTSIKVYTDMAFTSFDVTRSKGDGKNTIRFSLLAKQIRKVETETTQVGKIKAAEPLDNSAKGNAKSKGKKGKKNADTAQTEQAKESFLSKGLGSLF